VFDNKIILLTGGTGSFGHAMTKELLTNHSPKVIRVFSRGEFLQDEMKKKFNDSRLRFFIGDVRDKDRLHRAMKGVDIVIHAAALKQIPACEYCPEEAIKTNIDGSMNVIYSALENEVSRVIAISTDKATSPNTLYGATKLVMEKLIVQANAYVGTGITRFACVRYGNVIGSRGSVIPLFLQQKESGELTITDKDMTRFWFTVEQGVQFVVKCLRDMKGGEIFIPKIPSMKIIDMADVIAPKAKKRFIGIRQAEKLHEILFNNEESRHTIEQDDRFVILPEDVFWDGTTWKGNLTLIKEYTSDTNTQWLSPKELKVMIGNK
jgi:UDP-N-acetylglucosamine 4,6-dehydratase